MPVCPVCHAEESREERADEVFRIGGQCVLVGGISRLRCVPDAASKPSAERP